ncbi:hypothetical protein QVD17_05890 [Tagetes erecta]|uniref:Uncharacterized protein n=1 Tax=Tagetes erecta TaxID=13708 RepID=A0AAD8LMF4_TARER|nr:hypothetical protein QVD17_05890 [Tagetes erecta]
MLLWFFKPLYRYYYSISRCVLISVCPKCGKDQVILLINMQVTTTPSPPPLQPHHQYYTTFSLSNVHGQDHGLVQKRWPDKNSDCQYPILDHGHCLIIFHGNEALNNNQSQTPPFLQIHR